MSEQNPYQSPETSGAKLQSRRDWPAILSRVVGTLLIAWALVTFFSNGVLSISLLALGVVLLASSSVYEALFGLNTRQVHRRLKERFAERADERPDNLPSPEEFLQQLERDS